MFRSLRAQLGLVFTGFLLLVGSSAVATYLAIDAQSHDAVVINLAGRQRMLTQRMTWLAYAHPDNPELALSIQRFEQTLAALRNGGVAQDSSGHDVLLPVAPDAVVAAQLEKVEGTWTTFRARLEALQARPPTDETRRATEQALLEESTRILAELDAIVASYEARAEAKLLHLQIFQTAFVGVALLLLAWGYFLTRKRILQPLHRLGAVARRIGGGQITEPMPPMRADEFGALGRSLEAMRAEIAAAQKVLEQRVRQRTHELAAAFEFSQEIVAQLDLERLLRSVTDRARALMRASDAKLCLLRPEGDALELAASSGLDDCFTNRVQPVQQGLAAQVVSAGRTVVAESVGMNCVFLRPHTAGQCAAAPLQVGETTLGALCVIRETDDGFDADETRALTLLANSAAIAIANARLVETGREQAQNAAALAERERLAAELHDNLAQTLRFLSLRVDQIQAQLVDAPVAPELSRMQAVLDAAYDQVRAALAGLRAPMPAADDLGEELAACVAEISTGADFSVEFVLADPSALALPRVAQTQALHIVREALTNVRRHADARRVWVRVERVNGEALFSVEDDGLGIDPHADVGPNHLGISIMRTRAERSGGRLHVHSAPGAGVKVTAVFPLHDSSARSDNSRLPLSAATVDV